jgi:hypothetical protein
MTTFELSKKTFDEVLRLARLYYGEAKKCQDAKAFLAGCVMIGAAFEALLLSFADCYPDEVMNSKVAPRANGEVKPLINWSLSNLLDVAKDQNWLPAALSTDEDWNDAKAQIGDYGEVIRLIRNLVHPARYATDMPRKRITKKYLERSFEIIDVANDYLMDRIGKSFRVAIEQEEGKDT